MGNTKIHKPGEKVERSAQVEIVGPRGGRTGKERTVVLDKIYPPTPKPGQGYIDVDPTKNNAGKGKK